MNSGIKENGWTAPFLSLDNIVKINVTAFYSGAGAKCKQYESAFQTIGDKYHIDPVILASIAMQESSCNADVSGGLMQVYCGNYDNGRCTNDIIPNVDAGAKYLRTQLDASKNNIIKAFGLYNGWFTATESYGKNGGRGLTEDYPCHGGVGNGGPQNLDYLQQMLNGWLLGRDPQGVDSFIGSYHCQNCKNGALC
ncbi:hypothetical protein GP486_004170 [Trichoglossum hirsutum]|uniref:Transglycosylase SLT domain-containing protein n=1 Tax=Trichoglossum hirsutum TaxID=265104 RepID=A0A9P8LBQ1_9PEZI|nr:hypothetical protein GP486_004170 [Trichoglossum hirsutum]